VKQAALLALGLLGCAHGAKPPAASPPEPVQLSPEQVVVVAIAGPTRVSVGGNAEVTITLHIADGYHVMSDHPSNPLYIPTSLRVDSKPPLVWDSASFPAPHEFRLVDETITTFEGDVVLRVPVHVAGDAMPGVYVSQVTLSYQSCTTANCLFPVKRALSVQLEVVP